MDKKQRAYIDVLALHSANMFSKLIYESDITSSNLKQIEEMDFQDCMEGYFAHKNKTKYWIEPETFKQLPIRVGKDIERLKYKEDIVIRPLKPTPFKITAADTITTRCLINEIAPFSHSNPMHYTLLKMLVVMGYVGRIFCCISSNSGFGKSFVYEAIHYLTDKSPVYKPRSIPGALNQLNETGNVIFDETQAAKKEVLDIIEELALQIGGGKPQYLNGAMKSKNTKNRYNCLLQSLTFLFNDTTNYDEPHKDFFDFIFRNNKAVDDRFLKLKLDGTLIEKWDKDFDIPRVANDNKMWYIHIAKKLLYLQEQKQKNEYKRRYQVNSVLQLKGRRRMIYWDITWLIDQYCLDQEEFDSYIKVLDKSIIDYKTMVDKVDGIPIEVIEEQI